MRLLESFHLECSRCEDCSSHLQIFFRIDVLKNLGIFTGKHLCWSLFLVKLQAFRQNLAYGEGGSQGMDNGAIT